MYENSLSFKKENSRQIKEQTKIKTNLAIYIICSDNLNLIILD